MFSNRESWHVIIEQEKLIYNETMNLELRANRKLYQYTLREFCASTYYARGQVIVYIYKISTNTLDLGIHSRTKEKAYMQGYLT